MAGIADMIQDPSKPAVIDAADPTTPVEPSDPVAYHGLEDVDYMRKTIFDDVQKSVSETFPVENDRYKIQLTNVRYKGPDTYTKKKQKEALLKRKDLNRNLYGKWQMIDKATGGVVDERDELVAHVPYITERGTFIRKGSEYSVSNQSRLKAGVYTSQRQNGHIQSHFNIGAGGRGFKLNMDPATGKMEMHVGSAKLKLFPVLKAMGVDTAKLRGDFGEKLFRSNNVMDDSAKRAADQFGAESESELLQTFSKMELDPETTELTLNNKYTNVTPDVIVAAAKKMIGVSREEANEDNRDSIAFQKIMSPAQLMAERIRKDKDGLIRRNLLWKSTNKGKLATQSGFLSPHLNAVFQQSGLAQCFDSKTSVLTRRGFVPWPEVTSDDEFACNINGKLEWHKSDRLVREHYTGPMVKVRTKRVSYMVTPNHRIWHRSINSDSQYKIEEALDIFGSSYYLRSSLLPLNPAHFGDSEMRLTSVDNRHGHELSATFNMEQWAEFLGWYVSEGSSWKTERDSGTGYRVVISQMRKRHWESINDLLQSMGVTYNYNDGNHSFVLSSNKLIYEAVLACGQGCRNKRIPRYLFDQPESVLHAFFDAYMRGDGHLEKGKYYKATTASKQLSEDLVELGGRLGYTARVSVTAKKDGAQYYVVTFSCSPETTVTNTPSSQKRGKPNPYSQELYDGTVYCASVPGGLLYVLRDGKPHWSGNSLEEVNPIETLDQQYRVLRTGEGGVSKDRVTMESRAVQPSHFGIIDPVRSPESGGVGVDQRFAYGVVRGSDGKLYTKLRKPDGSITPIRTDKAANSIIAFPGELKSSKRKVRAMVRGKLDFIDRRMVDYELPSTAGMSTMGVNMIPMVSSVLGQRALMGAKYFNQALPLAEPEAPLVQALSDEEDKTYEHLYGTKAGAMRSEVAGRVVKVTKDNIHIQTPNGVKKVEMYDNFPFNRKSYISNKPTVAVGDTVKPGSLLATSNFTDKDGTLALGKNLNTAYLAWKGNNDDGIVISESAAQKLKSEHMYSKKIDHDSVTQRGKKEFMSMYPSTFTKDQVKLLDDRGIVKPGMTLKKGDPMILAIREKPMTDIHRGRKPGWMDASEVWNHEADGVVTDVEASDKGVRISVKSYEPMQVGDKLCFDNETDVLTDRGWIHFSELTLDDKVATLVGEELVYIEPVQLVNYHYTGKMYHIESQQVDSVVTPNHKQYVRKRGKNKDFELLTPDEVYGKRVSYKKNSIWRGAQDASVTLPPMTVTAGQSGRGTRVLPEVVIPANIYMTLLGAFLSDGNVFWHEASGNYGIDITQIKKENKKELEDALSSLCVNYTYMKATSKYRIYGKQLAEHFKQFGKAADKFIPAFVFNMSSELLTVLFNWLMWGDGHRKSTGRPESYYTISKRLADDVQRLCLHIGYAANVHLDRDATRGSIKGVEYSFQPYYRVAILTKKLTPSVNHGHVKRQSAQKEEWIDYSGPVWCCTMPVGNVIYVRRNGKPMWSGNCGRYGDKGVVSEVVPDGKMPRNKNGDPMEVLLNPVGVVSRVNPAQLIEAALGKIAQKTGKPVKMPGFMKESMIDFAMKELQKHGLSDTEDLHDADSDRVYKGIMTGPRFLLKLHHTSEKKLSSRSTGGYTEEGQPAKGAGGDSAKRVGVSDINALISHGATEVLKDAKMIRGQANHDFWKAFQLGRTPPSPDIPPIYKKFMAHMKGAGINVNKTGGGQLQIMALTDKDIDKLSRGEVKEPKGVDIATMKEMPGGLFDKSLTGGHGGSHWSHIKLSEPMPNPVMEEPIRRMLGLTKGRFADVLSGKERLYGQTGGKAIQEALSRINLKKLKIKTQDTIESGAKSRRNDAVKLMGYVKMMEETGLKPTDMVLTKAPVLPPAFRPISTTDKFTIKADANDLYVDLMKANAAHREVKENFGDDDAGEEKLNLYNSFKAVTGLGDPINPKLKNQGVRGLLKQVFGNSPKFGLFQRKLLSTTADISGRGVVTPNSALDMDHVGLPEKMAWELYSKPVIRRMVRRGMKPADALRNITEKSKVAREVLVEEMENRPIIMNRAPTLHKYNLMAVRPTLTKGNTIQVSPLITGGFNMDFDGDQQFDHVYLVLTKDLQKDIMQTCQNFDGGTDMTARFKEVVPLVEGESVRMVHLDAFPHTELVKTTRGQFGHIDWYSVPSGVNVITYDESTGSLTTQPVSHWSVHHDCPVDIVRMKSGREIFTDDDPRAVYGVKAGTLTPARFTPDEALKHNVLVPRMRTLDHTAGVTPVTSVVPYNYITHNERGRASVLKPELQLDSDFGYFLGVMVGDGWITGSNGVDKDVAIAGITEEVLVQIDNVIPKLFTGKHPRRCTVESTASYGESRRHTYTSTDLAQFVSQLICKGAGNKQLPPFYLSAPEEFRKALFAGLMDTDGSISISKAKKKHQLMANYTTISLKLAQEVQLLAASLGVVSRITASKTPAGKPAWVVSLSSIGIKKLNGKYMKHPEKLRKVAEVYVNAESGVAVRNDLIPVTSAIVDAISKAIPTPKDHKKWPEGQSSVYTSIRQSKDRGYIPRETAKRALTYMTTSPEELPDWDTWKSILYGDDVTWDMVDAVEKTGIVETGYDLTVPGTETFMSSSGVILSNTAQMHVPISQEAVKESYEKMLPSQNLFAISDFDVHYLPTQEFQHGLYMASKKKKGDKRKPVVFDSTEEAIRAYKKGILDVDQPISVRASRKRS